MNFNPLNIKFLVVLFFVGMLLGGVKSNASESLNVLALMHDAQHIKTQYKVNLTVESPYKVKKVVPYYYSASRGIVRKLPEQERVLYNNIIFDFEQVPLSQEYLVFHVTYGPHFVFQKHSEAICVTPIKSSSIVENIICDTYTTANYLIAAVEVTDSFEEVITAPILERFLELPDLPQIQSWQNLQAIITFTLNHVSEKPEYLLVNLPGNYLSTMYQFTSDMLDTMLSKRMINIIDYEYSLTNIDKSMVDIGYRVLISFENIAKQHQQNLPYVYEYPTYLEDFFSGLSPFTLVESEAMTLPNVIFADNSVSFNRWPWFEHVKFSFSSDGKEDIALSNVIPVPVDAKHAYIRPYGKRNRFLRTVVQVFHESQSNDKSTLAKAD